MALIHRPIGKKLNRLHSILVVTHIIYRKTEPFDPLEGPYASVGDALVDMGYSVSTLQIPLDDFKLPLVYGEWQNNVKNLQIPSLLGVIKPVKYILDAIIVFCYVLANCLAAKNNSKIVIAIDPLTCIPLILLKRITSFKLIYYAVDFNRERFGNSVLQSLYEKADELSSRNCDQCWVVSRSMKEYKKTNFGVEALHISNSSPFDASIYKKGKKFKTGNKIGWSGSFLSDKQFVIFFKLIAKIQKLRPDLEFHIAPTGKHELFKKYGAKYKIDKMIILYLSSRKEWQEYAAKLDIGLAIYDPDFGMTKFLEPLKSWDYLLCGMPFIVSSEPTLQESVESSGVAYVLGPRNAVNNESTLTDFLHKSNIAKLQSRCIDLARKFDMKKQIENSFKMLTN